MTEQTEPEQTEPEQTEPEQGAGWVVYDRTLERFVGPTHTSKAKATAYGKKILPSGHDREIRPVS